MNNTNGEIFWTVIRNVWFPVVKTRAFVETKMENTGTRGINIAVQKIPDLFIREKASAEAPAQHGNYMSHWHSAMLSPTDILRLGPATPGKIGLRMCQGLCTDCKSSRDSRRNCKIRLGSNPW